MGVAANRKPTLGGIFKSSLIELMHTINSTDVHYIRCIKPNESKESWKFEGPMVLSQLRACGVLETVRISCAGYPTRWTYEEFALRYYMLVPSQQWTSEIRDMANAILKKALGQGTNRGLDKYQLGLTKIFFRAGMLAFLENLRTTRLNECAVMIQKNLRCQVLQEKVSSKRGTRYYCFKHRLGVIKRDKQAENVRQIGLRLPSRGSGVATRTRSVLTRYGQTSSCYKVSPKVSSAGESLWRQEWAMQLSRYNDHGGLEDNYVRGGNIVRRLLSSRAYGEGRRPDEVIRHYAKRPEI